MAENATQGTLKPRADPKPKPKVLAAFITAMVAAAIAFAANLVGVDIDQNVALGIAGGALAALGGGYFKSEKPAA